MADSISMTTNNRIWSDEQNAIFSWFRSGTGHLVVQARAGTGKTTTIVEAFKHAPEAKICYAVFNKKNQVEAQGKITDPRVEVKTLHALGYAFIRKMWVGVKPDGLVERDRVQAVFRAMKLPVEVSYEIVTQVCRLVSFAKNLTIDPTVEDLVNIALDRGVDVGEDDELAENGGFSVETLAKVAHKALALSKERDAQNRISFDDMVWLPVAMKWVRAWFDLVVVDECQDMNLPQLSMAIGACKRSGRICVVGDDRQAIYGFRGAASDGMGMMRERLNARTLGLATTYRCPKSVVQVAAQIVSEYIADDSNPEGIVDECGKNQLLREVQPGDAILSRVNAPLMPLCLALLRQGTPARIEGRDIGKQLANIVRKFKARSVPECLTRLTAWGARQIKRLTAANKEAQVELVQDQVATISAIAEGAANVEEIYERLENLFQDSENGQSLAVVLSSVHKAKGLEWDHVWALGETFRPTKGEEEANIYYVAVTRAKQQLTFVR
jgi:DNA helicase-2/ATP-dependent DNA helicase PcrA